MANSEAFQENLNLVKFDILDEDLLDKIFEEDSNKAFEKVCDPFSYINLISRFFKEIHIIQEIYLIY